MSPAATPPARTPRHRVRRALLACAGLVAAVLPVVLLTAPPQSPPGRADVVVVLGPPQAWRLDWAVRLVGSGRADALLVFTAPGDEPALCTAPGTLDVTCAVPEPFSTRGEARHVRDAMAARGWTRATVVTATPNLLRAQLLLDRCVDGAQVVARREDLAPDRWFARYLWQVGGWAKAVARTGC